MFKSVVLLPDVEAHRWMMICAQYCEARHYEIVAVVHAWADAIRMIKDGRATVLVAGRHDHLPPDRSPRVEIVVEQNEPTSTRPERRRPVRRTRDRRPATRS